MFSVSSIHRLPNKLKSEILKSAPNKTVNCKTVNDTSTKTPSRWTFAISIPGIVGAFLDNRRCVFID